MKKKIILSIAAIAAVGILTGCGGSSSSDNTSTSTTPTSTVKVVDGYVIGANVCDGNGVCATTNGQGEATAAFDLNTSLKACGGYIDVNNNGAIDDSDIQVPSDACVYAPAGSTVISPITDLLASGADATKLAEVLGMDPSVLTTDPIATNNVELAKAVQIAFTVMVEGKTSDFVNEINSYTPEANTTSSTTTTTTSTIGTNSYLPLGAVTTAEDNATGSIDVFAELANKVITNTDAQAFINSVVEVNATNAADVEADLATQKKDLVMSVTASAETNTTTAETNTTVETNTTTTESNTSTESTTTTNIGSGSYLPL